MTKKEATDVLIDIIKDYRDLKNYVLIEQHANSAELAAIVEDVPIYDIKWLNSEKEQLNVRLRLAIDAVNSLTK